MRLNNHIFFAPDEPPAGGDPNKPDPKPDPKPEPKTDPEPQAQTVPYDRFKTINEEKKALEQQLADITKKQKEADETALKDQNKYKELYEQKEKELNETKKETMRLKVAARKGLPAELIDRLKGETEGELEADADKLLEFVTVDELGHGVPPRKKGAQPLVLDVHTMTPKEVRENSDKLLEQLATEFGKQ